MDKTSVLVLDDDQNLTRIIAEFLERAGFDCTVRHDGAAGQDALKVGDFDVALLDINMPEMDGLTLLGELANQDSATVPIVISGYSESEYIKEALRNNAFDFLVKPVRREVLVETVQRAAAHSRALRRAIDARVLANEWERILDASPDMVFVLDSHGRVVACNSVFANSVAASKEELIGTHLRGLHSDDSYDWIASLLDQGADRECVEVSCPRQNRYFEVTRSPLSDAKGQVYCQVYVVHEITARKQMAMQLHQAQKLESIGQLAAGVAHEINTPTQYVGDNIRFLENSFRELLAIVDAAQAAAETLDDPSALAARSGELAAALDAADLEFLVEEIPSAISESLEGVRRVSEIVRALKRFSHPGTEDKQPIEINEALQNTLVVARNEWKYVADVELDLDSSLPTVMCFPGELNQAFLNIIVNAADAIRERLGGEAAEKGRITVSTRAVDGHVEVRIGDTGCGIPDHIRDRVFDPFFTTKEVGKGTGQGLNIAYSAVVDKNGGHIEFDSTPGAGTTFTIRLPIEAAQLVEV